MRKFYFGDKPITKEALEDLVRCCGDVHFTMGIQEVVDYQTDNEITSPTYFYKFTRRSPKLMSKVIFNSWYDGT